MCRYIYQLKHAYTDNPYVRTLNNKCHYSSDILLNEVHAGLTMCARFLEITFVWILVHMLMCV